MNRNAEKRRSQILRAAFQAVSDKGFDTVTLQNISDYAGVSKGVTNYYFNSKDEVFGNLFEWVTHRINGNEWTAVNNQKTSLEKLKAYVNAAFTSPEENRKFFRVYLDFLAQANHNPRFQEINDQFYENCWAIGREIVSLGQKEGIFSGIDIEEAAVSIRASIDGCLIQWLMRRQDELHDFYRKVCYQTIVGYLTSLD